MNVEITEERYFSPHHMLLRAAGASVFAAQQRHVSGRELHILTAMVMSALSVEALCNAIGYRVVPGWKDFEQIPAWAKIRLLCGTLKIDYDKGCAPWQQLKALLAFRNATAHGKPERVLAKYTLANADYDGLAVNRIQEPLSKFESSITLENARLSLACVREVERILTSRLPFESQMGLMVEAWTHCVTEVD